MELDWNGNEKTGIKEFMQDLILTYAGYASAVCVVRQHDAWRWPLRKSGWPGAGDAFSLQAILFYNYTHQQRYEREMRPRP
jgi:hypothetical protein